MANPRKFSEKIALHNQKQAEGTAEFERVMREVLDVTNKPGGLGCLEGGGEPLKQSHHQHQHQQSHHAGYRERPGSAVGPIRSHHRPTDKRSDHSPYGSTAYLSPPSNSWRRTHSDSSLHTSSHENNTMRRTGVNESQTQIPDEYDQMKRSFSCTPDGRPRSAIDMPRVPGISIYPSQDQGGNQIPISSNTGSLPDLSSFHMAMMSPLDIPLDHEESSYLNNSHGGSPRSNSPTQQYMRNQRFTFNSSPHEAPGPPQQMNHVNRNPRHSPHPWHSPQPPRYSFYNKYGMPSPSSSPQSPPSPSGSVCKMSPSLEQNHLYISQEQVALQHHFANFNMREDNCTKLRSPDLTSDLYCNTPPPVVNHPYSRIPAPEPAATTPSSIPDITLTDFSNGDDFGKDYMADLFSPEESLREGLGPIDIDELRMLADPTLIADSATEDHLRHDGL